MDWYQLILIVILTSAINWLAHRLAVAKATQKILEALVGNEDCEITISYGQKGDHARR